MANPVPVSYSSPVPKVGGGREIFPNASLDLIAAAPELLEALRQILDLRSPITGNPTHAQLVEYWEYEKSQGNGEADANLFALATIKKAESSQS